MSTLMRRWPTRWWLPAPNACENSGVAPNVVESSSIFCEKLAYMRAIPAAPTSTAPFGRWPTASRRMVPGANAQSCAVDCGQASIKTLLTSALIFELPLLLSATTSASTASSDDDDSRVAPPCSALHLLLLVDVVPAAMALGDWHMGPGAALIYRPSKEHTAPRTTRFCPRFREGLLHSFACKSLHRNQCEDTVRRSGVLGAEIKSLAVDWVVFKSTARRDPLTCAWQCLVW